ncbi:DUF397 domain-containing protein [Streptomyces sp. NPDC014870]
MERHDVQPATWIRSSHSGDGANCLDVAPGFPGIVSFVRSL